MSTITRLNGWNIHLEPYTFRGKDDRGEETEVEGHRMVFTEMEPDTGDVIIFEFSDRVREYLHQETSPVRIPDFPPPNP